MEIGSITFNLIFLPLTCLVYFLIPGRNRTAKNVVLMLASLVFYAWGSVLYTAVLVFTIICNYYLGLGIGRRVKRERYSAAHSCMSFAVGINVVILAFFGYYSFFAESLDAVFGGSIAGRDFRIPLGIGIYTLSSIVYLVDVYRGKTEGETNILVLGLYIAMFPRITAGPLVSYGKLKEQILNRRETPALAGEGTGRMIIGLTKLVFLSAVAGDLWKQLLAENNALVTAWLGALACAAQAYFTWSGYSDLAAGLGGIFGFNIGENFKYPILSKSHMEFWKRWNISFTSFFKGYVMRPFNSSRNMRTLGIIIAWALYGLWYGPTWSCLVGGVYFAVFIILERQVYGQALMRLPKILRYLYMIITVGVGCVFFGAGTLNGALNYIATMFGGGAGIVNSMTLYYLKTKGLFFLLLILCALPFGKFQKRILLLRNRKLWTYLLTIAYGLLMVLCICWMV